MLMSDCLFWNVDTQVDFVSPSGKLYVPGAELLKPIWEKITDLAAIKKIQVINTADYHYPNSAELSENPDFITTFPEHCMANTTGAKYISETDPKYPVIIDWHQAFSISEEILTAKNIVIRKDAFDVFAGNPNTEAVLNIISPKIVIVYGVTTNVCVNDAVVGLAKRVQKVFVVEDAIKELPNIPLPFENWNKLGVKMIGLNKLEEMLNS